MAKTERKNVCRKCLTKRAGGYILFSSVDRLWKRVPGLEPGFVILEITVCLLTYTRFTRDYTQALGFLKGGIQGLVLSEGVR